MQLNYLASVQKQFRYAKLLGDQTFAQLQEQDFFWQFNPESNSIAIIVNHLCGNMQSRWTDFLYSDGEKEWRNRDREFEDIIKTSAQLVDSWERGWTYLFEALATLNEDNFDTPIYIRNQEHTVLEAINRQLGHYSYHVGQIVFIGRMIKGSDWKSLSIPKGGSAAYNADKFSKEKSKTHFTEEFMETPESKLTDDYWQNRYKAEQTAWDVGVISRPIKEYLDQLTDKNIKILVPGAGNAHEVEYAFQQGFKNVYLLDWAKQPLENFKKRVSDFPEEQLIKSDFFKHVGKYDLIIEQTFFCALPPYRRHQYVEHMSRLLESTGKLVGLLFNKTFEKEGPPFGGSLEEYHKLFGPYFNLKTMKPAYNSIEPRMGSEVFFIGVK